jgi:hypothetical protein
VEKAEGKVKRNRKRKRKIKIKSQTKAKVETQINRSKVSDSLPKRQPTRSTAVADIWRALGCEERGRKLSSACEGSRRQTRNHQIHSEE